MGTYTGPHTVTLRVEDGTFYAFMQTWEAEFRCTPVDETRLHAGELGLLTFSRTVEASHENQKNGPFFFDHLKYVADQTGIRKRTFHGAWEGERLIASGSSGAAIQGDGASLDQSL